MDYTSREVYEYVSKKLKDPIVKWKKCRLSWQEFPIYQSDLEFYDKVSPTFEVVEEYAKEFLEKNSDVKDSFEYKDGKLKAKIPTPTLCPEEREALRFAFRNEMNLYLSKSKLSGDNLISTISPDKDYMVYSYSEWEKYDWMINNLNIYDNSETFSKKMDVLVHNVPVRNKYWSNNENAEYVNIVANSKDSYLCFASEEVNKCLYNRYNTYWSYCVDCYQADYCETCYDCVKIDHCIGLFHCDNCISCSNSHYLFSCTNCHDCFNCSNLYNKSYCINNKQYTREEYDTLLWKSKIESIEKIFIWCKQEVCENCVWNNLLDCKDCSFIWSGVKCRNVRYTSFDLSDRNSNSEDCRDTYYSASNYCLSLISCRDSKFSGFISFWNNLVGCWYCFNCFNCTNCFGCVGLKYKKYHIFNKEYTEEEYNKVVPQIIAQMIRDKERGEFFNPQLSYYGYNESMAMDYYPLSKEEALRKWYKWSDYESPLPKVEKFVQWGDLPKQWCKIINEKKPEILEKILNYAVICEVSKKPFRITKQEIDFYIKHNLPLPTKHPNIRHQERLARKDPTTMHLINCDECGEEMLSVHLPWEWKKIMCEKCFYKNM